MHQYMILNSGPFFPCTRRSYKTTSDLTDTNIVLPPLTLSSFNRYTRYPEVVSLTGVMAENVSRFQPTKAENVVKAFISTWISHFGCPEKVTIDRS